MLRIGFVFFDVAAVLALVVDGVFLHVGLVNILGAHAERLRERDEKVKQVHDFDLGVLLVELLILGPPFPRHGVDQLGCLLLQGSRVVENPLRFFLVGCWGQIDADAGVEGGLHAEDFFEFIHAIRGMAAAAARQVRAAISSKSGGRRNYACVAGERG